MLLSVVHIDVGLNPTWVTKECLYIYVYGGVAQSEERLVRNQQAPGSKPGISTKLRNFIYTFMTEIYHNMNWSKDWKLFFFYLYSLLYIKLHYVHCGYGWIRTSNIYWINYSIALYQKIYFWANISRREKEITYIQCIIHI